MPSTITCIAESGTIDPSIGTSAWFVTVIFPASPNTSSRPMNEP
jgi:hypothetical protein